MNMKNYFILSSLILLSVLSEAKSIEDYRSAYPSNEKPSTFSSPADSLREMLGTNSSNMTAIEQVSKLKDQGLPQRKSHVSSFVRQSLLEKAREFMMKDQFDTPQLFEPSSTLTMEQVEEKIRAKSTAFCRENILPQLDTLIKEYLSQTDDGSASQSLKEVSPNKNKIISTFVNYLNEHASVGGAKKAFAMVLGSLQDIEIENATLSRLIFKTPTNTVLKLSLPMLISARTGEDYYFVQMLSCFQGLVNEKKVALDKDIKDGKSNNFKDRDLYSKIVSDFSQRTTGAEAVYSRLSILSKAQINSLIDLFLVFNKGAYATAEEWDLLKMQIIEKTQPLSQKVSMAEEQLRLNSNDSKLQEALKLAQAEYSSVQYMLADYSFFNESLDAFYRLENTLQQEKDRAALKKEKP
jgi:hypothetical protein